MITIRKYASSGLTGHVGILPANPSLPPTLAKLVQKTTPMTAPTKKCKQTIATGTAISAGMRRIWDQYRAGKYSASDYSVRTAQRHRKFFRAMGIDLRVPYGTSAPTKLSVPEPLAKPVKNKKKMMKSSPVTEPVSATSETRSMCASNALARVRSARAHQRRTAITTGLGAMAKFIR